MSVLALPQACRNDYGTTPLQMAAPACAPALRDVAAAGASARARLAEALVAEAAEAAAAAEAARAAAAARCGPTEGLLSQGSP